MEWLDSERAEREVYPRPEDVFAAFDLTSYDDIRVVILGQDPYPQLGQAHGLCFSVPSGIRKPRSLINIHKLLQSDLKIAPPDHGNLEGWARQGVLLLDTALTVRHGVAGSHADHWKVFTDAVIQAVNDKDKRVVFILCGAYARSKKKFIDTTRHRIVESAHPTSRQNATEPFMESIEDFPYVA